MLKRIQKAIEDKEEGFTLIELLVVMIIIGILAAIAIPVFLSQKKKAYETSLKSDLHQVATNIETALVDDPSAIAISGSGNEVDVTATVNSVAQTPLKVGLSSGNYLANAPVVSINLGTYCIQLAHGDSTAPAASDPTWKITANGTSQTLAKGAC